MAHRAAANYEAEEGSRPRQLRELLWLECLALINFDLEYGQRTDAVVPIGRLSTEDEQRLARVAFPDCNPDCDHGFIYHFLFEAISPPNADGGVRDRSTSHRGADVSGEDAATNGQESELLRRYGSSDRPLSEPVPKILLHGLAYYRNKKDAQCRRGHVQQGLVLLSRLPYIAAHDKIMRVLVPQFCAACVLSPDVETAPVASPMSATPSSSYPCVLPVRTPPTLPLLDISAEVALVSATEEAEKEEPFSTTKPLPSTSTNGGATGGLALEAERVDDAQATGLTTTTVWRGLGHATALSPHSLALPFPKRCDETPAVNTPSDSLQSRELSAASFPLQPPPQCPAGTYCTTQQAQVAVMMRCVAQIAQWPTPHPHVEYNVRLFGHALTFTTPPREATAAASLAGGSGYPENSTRHLPGGHVPAMLDDRVRLLGSQDPPMGPTCYVRLYSLLTPHLAHLSELWELMVSHEHLIVLSNTPAMASAAVSAVASLISPISYVGVCRPFLTVQDSMFPVLSSYGKGSTAFPSNEGVIVGCTNPFFVRAFHGWRNVMSIADPFAKSRQRSGPSSSDGDNSLTPSPQPPPDSVVNPSCPSSSDSGNGGGLAAAAAAAVANASRLLGGLGSGGGGGGAAVTGSASSKWDGLVWAFSEVFATPYPFALNHKKETAELAFRLQQTPSALGAKAKDDVARQFFESRTNEFLRPLQQCFLLIASSQATPFQLCCPSARMLFAAQTFLAYVESSSLPPFLAKCKRSAVRQLYAAFCRGKLFDSWLQLAIDGAIRQQITEFNSATMANCLTEMQLVDCFLNLYRYTDTELACVDPDIVLVSSATAALAELALCVNDPLRTEFLSKAERLHI